ncbi:alpha-1,4-N-acetylglucosaminyltransferase-like isoform X1 [Mixophyes fleayi]|uniref:alpha-1,4-N-acetylglucosaminyltransferase-like isoform X1 n=2 Tax=Mixophyes fleayi TaxID=3061075 RepID=UPI003F4E11D3
MVKSDHIAIMLKALRILVVLLLFIALGFFYGITNKQHFFSYVSFISEGKIFKTLTSKLLTISEDATDVSTNITTGNISSSSPSPLDILEGGDNIFFLETTDRMQPPSLVLCAIESAARVYKDRPVVFFMKGLNDTNSEATAKKYFPALSSFTNVYFFPLKMEDILKDTPLLPWYTKVNPKAEIHWTHVSADACRLALMWKYGSLYMDTDTISIRTIPHKNFLAGESNKISSNGVFGFTSHDYFNWKSMLDFVQNYNGQIWGQQGPLLFSRILKQYCVLPNFKSVEDITCGNITFLHPDRFYPLRDASWRRYYEVWEKLPTFNDSYALHLWNYMSRGKLTMVPGSNTLVEHLYKQYCPSTYAVVIRS